MKLRRVLRLLILTEIGSGLICGVALWASRSSLPPVLRTFVENQKDQPRDVASWLAVASFFVLLVGWVGLWRLWRRARAVYTIGCALGVLCGLFGGPLVYPGFVNAAGHVSSLSSGLILGLIYFSDLRAHFGRPRLEPEVGAAEHDIEDPDAGSRASIGIRSHLRAGGFSVVGITILAAGNLFPIVMRSAGQSSQRGILSIAILVTASLILGVAIWLLVYVPMSILADRLASTAASRMGLTAVLSTLVLAAVTVGVLRPAGWKVLYFLMVSLVLGLGGAVYTYFKAGFARQLSARTAHAS